MTEYTVSKQEDGQFFKVQDAIDAIVREGIENATILVKEGCYEELVTIPKGIYGLKIKGEGKDKTKITYGNYAGIITKTGEKLGTNRSASVFIDADDVEFDGISFENSYVQEGFDSPGRQAVAVNSTGVGLIFKNCAFYGRQDTLYVREGSCIFKDCYIEGDIDFIFGAAEAIFVHCDIHSRNCGSIELNGYATAASTREKDEYGFIFYECSFTAPEEVPEKTVYLGRPWHPSAATEPVCSATILMNCNLGKHIKEEGWTFMGKVWPETERFFEYQSTGEGAYINEHRRQLTEKEAILVKKFVETKLSKLD